MLIQSRNARRQPRHSFTIDNFKGVDFTTSGFKVQKNRATRMENLIYEDGNVRKRKGWEEVCALPTSPVNGIFNFRLGERDVLLVYAGTRFYTLEWLPDRLLYGYTELNEVEGLLNNRIQCYVQEDKAYLVGCGKYLIIGDFGGGLEVKEAWKSDAVFIPTTTINIDADGENDEMRASLDAVNLLTPYRKNTFVGKNPESVQVGTTYTVDTAEIDAGSDVTVEILRWSDEEIEKIVFKNWTDDKTQLFAEGDDIEVVGSISFELGKITLYLLEQRPPDVNSSNITVTFSVTAEGQADAINLATISTFFGTDGTTDRLFLSGTRPQNIIYWSEAGDASYFPDNNYALLGTKTSAVKCFIRATDGTLMALKERHGNDWDVFYIKGSLVDSVDAQGDTIAYSRFTYTGGLLGDEILSPHVHGNLNGDDLVLTRQGVKGISLRENVSIANYTMQERGRMIKGKLLKHTLAERENATAFVYRDKYYLSLGGVCYIADSRFTFQADEDVASSFNYEWFYWTGIDARCFAEVEGVLYFGDTDGRIKRFHDGYVDTTYLALPSGSMSINQFTNCIEYNGLLDNELTEGEKIRFTSYDENGGEKIDIFGLKIDTTEISGFDAEGNIFIDANKIMQLHEGATIYADCKPDRGFEKHKPYTITKIDLDDNSIQISFEGEVIVPLLLGFSLYTKVTGKDLYVLNLDRENHTFQVSEYLNGAPVILSAYDGVLPILRDTVLYLKHNVVSSWYTPIFDFGSNMLAKTLLALTVSFEPLSGGGRVLVGYQTYNSSGYVYNLDMSERREILETAGSRALDFNDMNFEEFSFEAEFATSYTRSIKESNFNFIVFRFVSDTATACAVSGITAQYKINKMNKGVR